MHYFLEGFLSRASEIKKVISGDLLEVDMFCWFCCCSCSLIWRKNLFGKQQPCLGFSPVVVILAVGTDTQELLLLSEFLSDYF